MTLFEKFLVGCVTILWGGNFVVIRWGIEEIDPYVMTALRFALVAFPAIFFVPRPSVAVSLVALYGVLFGGGLWGVVNLAVAFGTPAGLASLLLQLSAFLTVISALIFFKESLSPAKVLGIICAFIGFAVIALFRGDEMPLIGVLLMFLAAISWTACNILIRKTKPENVLSFVIWSSLFVPIPVLLIPFFQNSGGMGDFLNLFAITEARGWISILIQSYLTTLLGYGVWTWAIARHGLVHVAPYSLLVPVSGLFFGWLFYHEIRSVSEIIGIGLILFGLLLLSLNFRTKARSEKMA